MYIFLHNNLSDHYEVKNSKKKYYLFIYFFLKKNNQISDSKLGFKMKIKSINFEKI